MRTCITVLLFAWLTIPNALSVEYSNEDNKQDLAIEESNWWWGQGTKQMLQMLHTHQVVTANAINQQQSFVSAPAQQAPSSTHIYTLPGAFPVQQPMNTGLQFANNGQYAQSSFMPVNSAHSNFQSHPSVLTFPG